MRFSLLLLAFSLSAVIALAEERINPNAIDICELMEEGYKHELVHVDGYISYLTGMSDNDYNFYGHKVKTANDFELLEAVENLSVYDYRTMKKVIEEECSSSKRLYGMDNYSRISITSCISKKTDREILVVSGRTDMTSDTIFDVKSDCELK